MVENKKYKVIVSDRAKRMLGTHIRFMAQVNKVFYQIQDSTVYVEYILDCRKDYGWLIH
ncbi:MAG: hypothetical protein NC121_19290 [Blautia sp.]|nr:hypothetical protein [Blautia sp.]